MIKNLVSLVRLEFMSKRYHQAVTKDMTSSSKFSASCVLSSCLWIPFLVVKAHVSGIHGSEVTHTGCQGARKRINLDNH